MTSTARRIVGIGLDFGTANSVVALAFDGGEVKRLELPADFAATQTYRSALMFWRDGRAVAHASSPAAIIARAIAGDGDQRFIQSIKTYLGSRAFGDPASAFQEGEERNDMLPGAPPARRDGPILPTPEARAEILEGAGSPRATSKHPGPSCPSSLSSALPAGYHECQRPLGSGPINLV